MKFDYLVKNSILIEGVTVVLLDVPVGKNINQNVFGVSADDKILWQIESQKQVYTDCPYINMTVFDDRKSLELYNWDGIVVRIDPKSGKILGKRETR